MALFNRGGFGSIPPITKHLIIINILIWLVEEISLKSGNNFIVQHLGLHFITASDFNPAQLITYMFVHDSNTFFHILFNMLTLYFFGPALERLWGARRYLFYYMICGVGAAVIQESLWALTWQHEYIDALAAQNHVSVSQFEMYVRQGLATGDQSLLDGMASFRNQLITVGASGAIFGLLLGFAFIYPNIPMYLFFIPVPIKAKYMIIGYAVIEFFFGVSGRMTSVAHFAHLGGMLFGLILILYWRHKGTLMKNRFNW